MPDRRRLYAFSLHRRVVSLFDINAGGCKHAYHRNQRGEYEDRNTLHLTLPVLDGNAALVGVVPPAEGRQDAGIQKTKAPRCVAGTVLLPAYCPLGISTTIEK